MRRLPARWQVTLAFAAALAVVLLAVGAFVYLRFDAELLRTVDAGLQSRAGEVVALVRRSGTDLGAAHTPALVDEEEGFTQVLASDGALLDATPGAPPVRLSAAELRRARAGPLFLERDGGGIDGDPARLLALPVAPEGKLVVVGASLDDRREALASLLALLAAGFAAALLLASAAGFWVAGVVLARIERARAVERDALARERRLVADASHELRTPLTVLKSEVEVTLHGERTAAELRMALESAGEEADRLVALAEDLLVLARADEGRLRLAPATVAVRELLDGVAAPRRGGAAAAARAIVVDAPPDLTVIADRGRLVQAVTNLLDNALRHGGGGIELLGENGAGEVRIAVRDHGRGFPAGFADRAFERFARPDAGRSGAGAGLGLAIVAAIARAHGGSVAALDAEPGARVQIVLPTSSTSHPPAGR